MVGRLATVYDFEDMFSTDEACAAYLFRIRWPDGFVMSALWLLGVVADESRTLPLQAL